MAARPRGADLPARVKCPGGPHLHGFGRGSARGRAGYQLVAGKNALLHLTLKAESPNPVILRVRLVAEDGADRRAGDEPELSVMDRTSCPGN